MTDGKKSDLDTFALIKGIGLLLIIAAAGWVGLLESINRSPWKDPVHLIPPIAVALIGAAMFFRKDPRDADA